MINTRSLPDFIIIGAMKCATTTLHRQLESQTGLYLTTPKEPNFFSDDEIYDKGESWYSSLFDEAKDGYLKGESSTHYTKLPDFPNTIDRMVKYGLQNPKLIYLIRHPIDRLVSHYTHQWTMRVISEDINNAIDNHLELINYSKYYEQLKPFLEWQKGKPILLCFFDSIYTQPQNLLEQVCSFLDYKGKPIWNENRKQENSSIKRWRKFPFSDFLIESGMMTSLRQHLIPKAVRSTIKTRLTMTSKPVIKPEKMSMLTEIFNEDLLKLSELINHKIDCENFRDFSRNNPSICVKNI
jgi:hypothetical protein